jgi:hypothetical protein
MYNTRQKKRPLFDGKEGHANIFSKTSYVISQIFKSYLEIGANTNILPNSVPAMIVSSAVSILLLRP